ncbi:hypothetical protein [Actinomadura montaniterrae]|uniref:Uncharacterized protein n=1 Tax=Actinomadura montaniterrae TaxID=1803903 RepID=A0A6L3VGF2_9ACTN|nr:hypothetical protein [Actinomadura montaniterrae]KAB2362939.1 hypothetical protein F9B16_44055 [Actinomadura montaniterrae]
MTVIPGLVRRAATEAEHRLRAGAGLLVRLGRDLERSAELERFLPSYGERVRLLEDTVREQDAALRTRDEEVRGLRAELDSLVAQLNDRLLPRIDERMDDTERDLAAVATSLIRTGRDTAGHGTRLEAAERRIGDLRTKLAQLEQRAGLWRDLQATMARLGEDVDALRARAALRAADPPAAEPAVAPVAPVAPVVTDRVTDRPA